ncbi:MAG: hypothetical protein JST04_08490 [Bdellovibrionales bacterium]|nr:hypothetical protein [Bdellovibrionales bacterium]
MAKKVEAQTQAPTAGKTYCGAEGCKTSDHRFGFCAEHYEQFKFGLIKKDGKPVSDYEKKFEHYEAFKRRVSAQKAA